MSSDKEESRETKPRRSIGTGKRPNAGTSTRNIGLASDMSSEMACGRRWMKRFSDYAGRPSTTRANSRKPGGKRNWRGLKHRARPDRAKTAEPFPICECRGSIHDGRYLARN